MNGLDQGPLVIQNPPKTLLSLTQPQNDNHLSRDNENNSIHASTTSLASRDLDMTESSKNTQHGCRLSLSDHDRIKIFIHEFITRGIIPWTERTLRTLNEQVNFYAFT